MSTSFHYSVYYTFRTDASSETVQKIQKRLFKFMDKQYGLDTEPTGYSHGMGIGRDLSKCEGLTQDLQFMRVEDVKHFVHAIQDISEICSITWNEHEKDSRTVVKDER